MKTKEIELENKAALLYKIYDNGYTYYEVFKRKLTPICIDFEKRIYSDTETKTRYPNNEDFGKWAWCYESFDLARNKYKYLTEIYKYGNK